MTFAFTCWATSGKPVCSHASRADRRLTAAGPGMTVADGASRSYRSASER
nr:hypothetical protein [Fodinicola feengrottensis]